LKYNLTPRFHKELNSKSTPPRYRVQYTVIDVIIDEETNLLLSKVKNKIENFNINVHGKQKALQLANSALLSFKTVYDQTSQLHEISIHEHYMRYINVKRNYFYAYRTGVEFPNYIELTKNDIEPYLLGAWLGDGTSSVTQITNIDPELIEYIYSIADKMNLQVTQGKGKGEIKYTFRRKDGSNRLTGNWFLTFLRRNNLIDNKHIPDYYKTNTRENRLALLAGLIDTDGWYDNDRKQYEITQKNKRLSYDILFLIRSLGYWCHIRPVKKGCMYKGEMRTGNYFRMTFGGFNMDKIPVLLPRKKGIKVLKRQKDSDCYNFTITEDVEDDYYGFEVSGTNMRYLLGDFTVTH
jgi:intein/homing endonuclease